MSAKVVVDYYGEGEELSMSCGDIVTNIMESEMEGWWRGEIDGRSGIFPLSFVELLDEKKTDAAKTEAKALYDNETEEPNELQFKQGI